MLGDLPEGIYKVSFKYGDDRVQTWVEIFPGQVTYFTYNPRDGFVLARPSAPTLEFLPEVLPPTPTAQP
ncbi:MAG: hypothetical protein HXY38_03980 [Chloroflexi bacterium]|nr:hypothetical protein [Chloroflexota bacterium]